MTDDAGRRSRGVALGCLGVIMAAAVVVLCPGPWHREAAPQGMAQRVGARSVSASVLMRAIDADRDVPGAFDDERPGVRPAALPGVVRHAVAGVVAWPGAPWPPITWPMTWPIVLLGLALGAVAAAGARTLRSRAGACQHGTRAPPVRA